MIDNQQQNVAKNIIWIIQHYIISHKDEREEQSYIYIYTYSYIYIYILYLYIYMNTGNNKTFQNIFYTIQYTNAMQVVFVIL